MLVITQQSPLATDAGPTGKYLIEIAQVPDDPAQPADLDTAPREFLLFDPDAPPGDRAAIIDAADASALWDETVLYAMGLPA